MTIVVASALAVAAFLYILFIRNEDVPEPVPVSPVQHLEDRKQAIYENLRDLQFEFRLGKLSDEDYASTKQALQRELAGVLSEMEETAKRLNLTLSARGAQARSSSATAAAKTKCANCGASFAGALKFCGECGRPIA